jgi:integral membrane protein (TIGR01906 family)
LRILGIAAKWLFILCLPVLLLTASIGGTVNSAWLYKYGFNRYGISQTTGLAEEELNKAATKLIDYFNSGEEYIDLVVEKDGEPFVLFNEREVGHLKDVKGLIRLDYTVLLWTFVYSLVYTLATLFYRRGTYRRHLAWGLVGGGGTTLVLMLALGLGTLLGFDQLFLQFHLLSFANELWQLDPTKDYMIMLFPRGFWYAAFLLWAGTTAGLAIILGGVGGLYLKKKRGQAA